MNYQVVQRGGGGTASITVEGSVGTGTHDIRAQFCNGGWQTIATAQTGTYSGTLTNCAGGQGTLEVEWVDDATQRAFLSIVGVGDVFVIAGQSNASGRDGQLNIYSSPSWTPTEFANDYTWKIAYDPTDAGPNVDSVSSGDAAAGSAWPLLSTSEMSNQRIPVAFIPCAFSGSSITAWVPSGSHTNRSSLYGSMVWRSGHAIQGGVKAVLFWDGETDAQNSMSQATWFSNYTNFSASVQADLGVKVMPCKLQNCSGLTALQQSTINAAIGQAWASDSNTLSGPDLTGIDTSPEDTLHIKTTPKMQTASDLWWTAIKTAFGW